MDAASENELFERIIVSMGIESFDPLVVAAVSEYARRFTSELLCDAKDYCNHRVASSGKRGELEVGDVKLAIRLNDAPTFGADPKDVIINETRDEINHQNLLELLDTDRIAVKYPKKSGGNLTQRTYTYIPGKEAYSQNEAVEKAGGSSRARSGELRSSANEDVRGSRNESRDGATEGVSFQWKGSAKRARES